MDNLFTFCIILLSSKPKGNSSTLSCLYNIETSHEIDRKKCAASRSLVCTISVERSPDEVMCIVIIYRHFDAFSLFSYSSTLLSSSSCFSLKKLFIVVHKIQGCLTCNIVLNKSVIIEVNWYPCISVLVVMMHTWDAA